MTNFIASVELQQAGTEDYRQLIQGMKQQSFVADNNNKTSGNLTFRLRSGKEIKDVIDTVLKLAAATGKQFSFTVMKDKHKDNKKRLSLQ